MLAFPILDVAIGLIFIYLLLSLVVSAATELLASVLRWRAEMLWSGIRNLIGDAGIAGKLYSHPLIRALRHDGKRKPSYIPSRTFALALLDTIAPADGTGKLLERIQGTLMRGDSNPGKQSQVAQTLALLLEDAGDDLDKFKASIEIWFNTGMERVSGWYKRKVQWVTVVLAVIVTVTANVDTIAVGNLLWRDPAVRTALVAQAQAYVEEARQRATERQGTAEMTSGGQEQGGPPPPPARLPFEGSDVEVEDRFDASLARLQTLAIPLGWQQDVADPLGAVPQHALGWLLTTLAISLGAPFWFDMLNKAISIRSTGKAPEERQKLPRAVPQPREPGAGPLTEEQG